VSLPGPWGAGSQRFADAWFQALAKSAVSAMEPALLVGLGKDAFEPVPANQPRWSPARVEDFDGLPWDEVSRELEWQADATALVGSQVRRDRAVQQPTPPGAVEHPAPNRAALDRYFAQTADDADQTSEDE
jgi:hypothetical protein